MSQADEGTVTLRDVVDAHGVYAVYGVPVDPVYMLALPVLFRAVLSGGGGDDEVVFLVNQRGAIVPAGDTPAVGELIGYYRAGHDQEAYIQQLTAAAQAAGRALHERLYPRPVAVIPPPLDGNDTSTRRSRRRRRNRVADIPTDIDAAATA